MLQVLRESNLADTTHSLMKRLKSLQDMFESLGTINSNIDDQVQVQMIRIKNSIDKIDNLLQML